MGEMVMSNTSKNQLTIISVHIPIEMKKDMVLLVNKGIFISVAELVRYSITNTLLNYTEVLEK